MPEQLTLWTDEELDGRPEHKVQEGSVKHRGDCPACKKDFDNGASWTSLPWSETYWAS